MLQDLRVIQKFKLDFPWQHNPTIPSLILNYKISLDFTRFKFWRHFGIFGKCSWNLMMSSCLKLDKFRGFFVSLLFLTRKETPKKSTFSLQNPFKSIGCISCVPLHWNLLKIHSISESFTLFAAFSPQKRVDFCPCINHQD